MGRLRTGPEADLTDDYLDRFTKTGRGLGLGPVTTHEVDTRKGGIATEAQGLTRAIGQANPVCILDERGKTLTSPEFANLLARWRDDGNSEAAFVIGGADGIAPGLRAKADASLSFGKMVWPHLLVRVMLAEQLYRAASILAGSPYHRE